MPATRKRANTACSSSSAAGAKRSRAATKAPAKAPAAAMAEDDAPTLQRQRSGRRAAANAIDDEPSKASLAAAVSAADAALSDASSDSDSDGEMDYEARRAANIRRNQEMLAALNIPTRIAREAEPKAKPHPVRGPRQSREQRETLPRRPPSLRLRGLKVNGDPLPDKPEPEPLYTRPQRIEADVPFVAEDEEDEDIKKDQARCLAGLRKLKAVKVAPPAKATPPAELQKQLQGLSIAESGVGKATRDRIYGIRFHPTRDRVLVAAGDKGGQVAFFDTNSDEPIVAFRPHIRPVGALEFNPFDSAQMFTTSYESLVRCTDLKAGAFALKITFSEDDPFLCHAGFDFKRSVMYGGHDEGILSVTDLRDAKPAFALLHDRKINHVSVNPCHENLLLTCGVEGTVQIWDVRKLSAKPSSTKPGKPSKPVLAFQQPRSVTSANFSPLTGNHVLTSAFDDTIRFYPNGATDPDAQPITVKHNNQTGRWLTTFKSMFHPCSDTIALSGSLERERGIDVLDFSALKGRPVSYRLTGELFTSVVSRLDVHPTSGAVVGGNSSGRLTILTK